MLPFEYGVYFDVTELAPSFLSRPKILRTPPQITRTSTSFLLPNRRQDIYAPLQDIGIVVTLHSNEDILQIA